MTVLTEMRERAASASSGRALRVVPLVAVLTDLGLVAVSVVLAALGRKHLPLFASGADVSSALPIVGPVLVIGWVALVYFCGGYRADVFGAGTDEYKRVFNASVVCAGLLGVGCYLAKFSLSRGFFFLAFTVGIPALLVGRWVGRRALHRARVAGRLQQAVIIAGTAPHIDEIGGVLRRESWLGYRILGAATPPGDTREETPAGIPVLGDTDDVTALVMKTEADVIFFADGSIGSGAMMRQAVWDLEQHNVQVVVAPSVTDISSERVKVRPVGGLPLMHIAPPTWANATRLSKRLFDVVVAALLVVAFAPVLLACVLAVKAADRGPVLFRQRRIGRNGMQFSCLKFRTMVIDAEERLAALHTEHGYESGLFKVKDDPRVTRPGRWLRRYSLDELPQLFNVLAGHMSLVGPRPPLPLEVEQYTEDASRRLQVRPGMTGLWQVSGRSDLTWQEALRLDLYYVDNWSMLQDLSILTKTLRAVLSRRGAY
jgi:exopolysaccharide biosynthesis polyprenyl glycosylphosphotransferase